MNKTSFLLLFLLPPSLEAQPEYPVAAIPAELLPNAHTVVRRDEMTINIQPSGDVEVEEFFVATILNEEGKSACLFVANEDPFSKIKLLKGRVFDADGKLVRSTKDEDIQVYGAGQEYEFTDNKSKYLQLEHPRYPFTVEFRKKYLLKGYLSIPHSAIQQLGKSVEQWRYQIIAPPDFKFKWKAPGIELQPRKTTKGDNIVWEWTAQNLPALPEEPYNPYLWDVVAELQIAPETINFDGHKGDFSTWKSTGQFFYALNNGREQLSPATIARVQELTAGKSTREKIAALYHVTQQDCRYVSIQLGIGGWQAFEAQFVEKKKYGDCKALSNYTQALLKAAGIEAWEATIFAGSEGAPAIDEAFPSPRFNHMILYVPGEDLWLECTSKIHPTGYLGTFTNDRYALLFSPEGGKLKKTPALSLEDNFENTLTQIRLKEDGSAEIQQQALFGGSKHEQYRHMGLEVTKEELEKFFTKNAPFSIVQLNQLKVTVDPQRAEARLDYGVVSPKFATVSGKRMFVPLTKTSPMKRSLPANDKRTLDLKMNDAYVLRDTFALYFPPGFEAENVPGGKKLDTAFGLYELKVEKMADRVLVMRQIEIRPVQVPAARYAEVRQFLIDAAKADAAQMVLLKKT